MENLETECHRIRIPEWFIILLSKTNIAFDKQKMDPMTMVSLTSDTYRRMENQSKHLLVCEGSDCLSNNFAILNPLNLDKVVYIELIECMIQ